MQLLSSVFTRNRSIEKKKNDRGEFIIFFIFNFTYSSNLCLSFCLFVSPIITYEPLDRFALNLIRELDRTTEMFFAFFKHLKLSVFTFNGVCRLY